MRNSQPKTKNTDLVKINIFAALVWCGATDSISFVSHTIGVDYAEIYEVPRDKTEAEDWSY